MRWLRVLIVVLSVSAVSVGSAAAAVVMENDTLRVEMSDDAPRIERIVHRPTGEQLPGPGDLIADWRIEFDGGAVDLSDCEITLAVAESMPVQPSWRVDTGRGVSFTVRAMLASDHLRLWVTDIEGPLRQVRFNEPWLSVTGDWTLASAEMMHGGVLSEACTEAESADRADWVVLSNGRVAATIQSNLWRFPNLIRRRGGACGLGSNDWQYALAGGHTTDPFDIVISVVGDLNGDGGADWQDGCIFLQGHQPGDAWKMDEALDLTERMLLGWVGIESAGESNGMNATFPQVLDIIRRQYYLTAGEPTAMGLAGWAYWGWDSEYPACEEGSRRAGGNAALAELCREAWRYGSQVSLCINHDDAYRHSPAWDPNILCTNRDGSPKIYMYWHGGLAYHICPYKDWTTGHVQQRIDTMFDFGMAGSCYIDVLSAALDKNSQGPGGDITWMDNLWAKFNIADYYWRNGLKLYSEHARYPFVGRILGGLNNRETGLDAADATKAPMPAFILHGYMNNFFSATRYGRAGRLLLGIVPNIGGHVNSPADEHLDLIYLQALPARTYVRQRMRSFDFDGERFTVTYDGGAEVTMAADGSDLHVVVDGREIADDTSCFVPRDEQSYWAYSTEVQTKSWPMPDGWSAEDVRVFALSAEGRHEEIIGFQRSEDGQLTLKMFSRVPLLVTAGQDVVPVGTDDYGRMQRRNPRPFVTDTPAAALRPPVTTGELPDGRRWELIRSSDVPADYTDKVHRRMDTLRITDGEEIVDIPVMGPAGEAVYDAARGQLIVASGAFNYDNVQFVDIESQRVVGMVPLVPQCWGDNMRLALGGDVLYVLAPNTRTVAAIRLDVPWPEASAQWAARVFEEGTDPRDPEAALDEFLRVRWDRLRAFHDLGFEAEWIVSRGTGFTAGRFDGQLSVAVTATAGPWQPEDEVAVAGPPHENLARAMEIPRERIVATNLPGDAQPWWLTLPREKHHIVPEPAPEHGYRFFSVSPRYPTEAEAREHAALIVAIRFSNRMQGRTTGALIDFGERRGLPRGSLRSGHDYWMIAKIFARTVITPEAVMDLPANQWYVETLAMPDGSTMYRAGLETVIPNETFERVYLGALEAERQWYLAAAERTDDAERARLYRDFARLYEDAATETLPIDWLAE